MTVSAIGSSSAPDPGGAGAAASSRDTFLRLLTAQLAHQDPLQPMDSYEFTAQLAQFSQLEQLQGLGGRLDSLLLAQAAANQTLSASLVGRDVVHRTDRVRLEGDGAEVRAVLGADAASVVATVQDASGRTVRTLRAGPADAGSVVLAWDGRDERGEPLPPGSYTVKVVAAAADGTPVDASPVARARVNGVSFAHGYPELVAGGTRIRLSDVVEIAEAE